MLTMLLKRLTGLFNTEHQQRAIERARIVQREVKRLRGSLKNGHWEGKLLASYDAELSRLATMPGVMEMLLSEFKNGSDYDPLNKE